ncbi:MAG: hypothetical protein RLZZ262_2002 [Bacteroidota bacterium]|jgi:hypothetical protein
MQKAREYTLKSIILSVENTRFYSQNLIFKGPEFQSSVGVENQMFLSLK